MMIAEDHIPHPLYRTRFIFRKTITGEEAQLFAEALDEMAVSVLLHNSESADGDNWDVTLTTYGEPLKKDIVQALQSSIVDLSAFLADNGIIIEKLPETDWLRHVHDNFPPVTIGQFFVYGSHHTGEIPADKIPLKIDAATAFGSGEHETTRGCMLALIDLAQTETFKNSLDMGCGSGILAIAATKLWPGIKATAIDIDPESVIVTERHAEMNGVTGMDIEAGDGYAAAKAISNAPYDLVIANILAGPLIEMAPDVNKVLKPGGYCVLSGLLARQEDDVTKAHVDLGLTPHPVYRIGDWRALVFKKP